jgi:hypothetical protein
MAPMAPEPLVPEMFTPVKVMTVRDDTTDWERFAETWALPKALGAKARQISEVPDWVLVRTTRAHVRPPPVTLCTVVFGDFT